MDNYKNVQFKFLSEEEEPFSLRGMVLIREKEMVLEVEHPDDRPYTIVGKERGGFFKGVHEGLPGDTPVSAKWTRLESIWIGTWLEEEITYWFSFKLV